MSPKGRILLNQLKSGIPAPRSSRRETPINRATRYLGGTRCVKAIPALLTAGGEVSGLGGWGASKRGRRGKRRIVVVFLFGNVPQYFRMVLYFKAVPR